MAIFDAKLLFSEDQDIGQVAGSYDSTNVVLLGDVREIGIGEPLTVSFTITEAVTTGSTSEVDFKVVTDDNAALTSALILASTGPVDSGQLTLGKKFTLTIPRPAANDVEAYLGVIYTISTATTTAGTVTAGIVFDADSN